MNRFSTRKRGPALVLGLALSAALGLASPLAASATPDQGGSDAPVEGGPAYITGLDAVHEHIESELRLPTSAWQDALRQSPDEPATSPSRPSMTVAPSGAAAKGLRGAAAECAIANFAAAEGAALANLVKASTTDCVNTLFQAKGAQAKAIFKESQMVTIANALKTVSQSYDGTNSGSAAQLVLFLRAGYYVQYYDAANVGSYGSAMTTAIRGALDAFFGNSHSRDVTDANGETLAEAITLIDSSEQNARYIPVIKDLLNGYNSSYDASWWMLNAVNNTFTVLFRGHQVPAFVQAVAQDGSLLTTLRDFAQTHIGILGTDNAYLVTNAGRELARFLGDPSVKAAAKPLVKSLLDQTNITGPTSGLWVGLAEMTVTYDNGACSYYGTCDLEQRLGDAILVTTHQCSASITIRAQDMNASELDASCASLNAQDAYFHAVAKDSGPVPNDVNTKIEVVVFNSSTDYQAYAGALFGIDTNNGGMYLEGNPAVAGNKARFIAYEADWLRPTFAIWNLNHEYTHYLDGRFNMHGDFGSNMLTPTIWWVEGFAEYISYHYRGEAYTAAQQAAAKKTYKLSQLFDTSYDHDTERIYRWGYLAVSFMLNKHPQEMQTVLNFYRNGQWNQARAYLKNSIGTTYDAEFAGYLTECAAGNCSADLGGGSEPQPGNQAPTAQFTATVDGLDVIFADGSSDSDGTIASRSWDFGNGTGSTETNPSVSYDADGTYTVTLTVTDDKGATATVSHPVTVTSGDVDPGPGTDPGEGTEWPVTVCGDADDRMLGQACGRMARAAGAGDDDHLLLWIPAGTPRLTITAGGGTGNADLYYNSYGWASADAHVDRSTNDGNGEQIVIDWPAAGWNYVNLHGAEAFSGVSVIAHY